MDRRRRYNLQMVTLFATYFRSVVWRWYYDAAFGQGEAGGGRGTEESYSETA